MVKVNSDGLPPNCNGLSTQYPGRNVMEVLPRLTGVAIRLEVLTRWSLVRLTRWLRWQLEESWCPPSTPRFSPAAQNEVVPGEEGGDDVQEGLQRGQDV